MRCSLPSRSAFGLLVRKECRDLAASRAFWLMLLVASALVAHAFSTSVSLYAEASGAGGGPAALAQGLNPREGIVVPTLGAYELVAMLLLPFLVIRSFSVERTTGSQTLLRQMPVSFLFTVATKALVLLGAWVFTSVAGIIALALWRGIGGHLHAAEIMSVTLGHFFNGALTIGVGAVAAVCSTSAATAAIVVLTATIGTWALDYAAAARGGWIADVARFTPSAALRVFDRGEVRADLVLVLTIVSVTGIAIASFWQHGGRPLSRRVRDMSLAAFVTAVAIAGAMRVRASVDLTESRANSLTTADEAAIRSLGPISITIHLAASDPRLQDYEHGVLAKVRRIARVQVAYASTGRSGLFEGSGQHYGEIWYEVHGKRAMSRSVAEPVVLGAIYEAAGRAPPESAEENVYPGYPLAVRLSRNASFVLLAWPALILTAWWWTRRASRHGAMGD